MKNRKITLLVLVLLHAFVGVGASATKQSSSPRLVVNIVVSGMRYADLQRYADGFGEDGFARVLSGESFPYAYYAFAPSTPSALATLTTGANPSLHGVVGYGWWNWTSGQREGVVGDPQCSTFNADTPESRVSNRNLVVETFGDRVVASFEGSRSVSVATDPSSAIIMGGLNPTEVWWLDSLSGTWTTSTKYAVTLPKWVGNFNRTGYWRTQYTQPWVLSRSNESYLNATTVVAKPYGYKAPREEKRRGAVPKDVLEFGYRPTSNDVVAAFAKEAIIYGRLGGDSKPDVLNVCFDAPRRIVARYGLDSREVEDMYYRLDESIADLLTFASAQAGGRMVVVLTTDGGVCAAGDKNKLFNASQARLLINSFLSATYGKGDWVLGYERGGVWLNHTLIFSKGLSVEELQQQVATFALQLRGVSHAIVASSMMESNSKEGVAGVVQQGFYPKRSADVTLVLMPDWVEVWSDEERVVVSEGLPYAPYRRGFVALCGEGVGKECEVRQRVDMGSVVVTLSELVGVDVPLGAEESPLPQP